MSIVKLDNTPTRSWLDTIVWVLIFVLLSAGVLANHIFEAQPVSLRMIGWVFLCLACVGISLLTRQGKQTYKFAQDAWVELLRVVWPTKQETVQTTIVVSLMVLVVSLMIWGVDSLLLVVIGMLTGQRGS